MAENTYKTVGAKQINAYIVPYTSTAAGWMALSSGVEGDIEALMDACQINRCQSVGLGAVDLSFRKRYETGQQAYIELVPSSSVDKPVTIEWQEYGSFHNWDLLAGKDTEATGDITQADFAANSSECAIVVHKTDTSNNVIESDIIWRCVVDTWGISVPNSQDDDVRCSVRLTGDEWIMAGNTAKKIVFDNYTAGADGVVDIHNAIEDAVELDDWPDNDSTGQATSTLFGGAEIQDQTSLTVEDETGFAAGQDILLWADDSNWETARVASTSADTIVVQDGVELAAGYADGDMVRRTRGFFFFVYNATTNEYLELGTDYRIVEDTGDVKLYNVDGGTALTVADEVWCFWAVNDATEYWTADTSNLFGVTPSMCKLMVAPDGDFDTTTACYSVSVVEDTESDFTTSGGGAAGAWWAIEFTAGADGKIASATTELDVTGSPLGRIWAEIYTDDGGAPSEPLAKLAGNPSEEVDITALGATPADCTFYWTDGPDLTSGTVYWVVLKTAGYAYNDGVDDLMLRTFTAASDTVFNGDGDEVAGVAWVDANVAASLVVTCAGTQEIKRLQGYDISVTNSRNAFYESGNTQTIEREFDETDVRLTLPMMESDITTLARAGQKNPSSVKTMRPELAPEVGMRLEVYENDQKLSGGIKIVYEFPNVKRSGFEKTATANERATKRITMTGDTFTITRSL